MDVRNTRPRVGLLTFGCRVNQYETQMMRALLTRHFELVDEPADVYLINACTVTSLAERKARQVVSRLRREQPQAKIVLIGCLADAATHGLCQIRDVDLVAGNVWKGKVDEVVHRALAGGSALLPAIDPVPLAQERSQKPSGRVRAFLKIQDGCDLACTFCSTTVIRGPSRSKPIPSVVSEARSLIEGGCPELVLVGINLSQYSPPGGDLVTLMQRLTRIDGLRRLRLGSINPAGITEQLVELITSERRACPHFHIPLQSGDDGVLRRMKRGYTTSFYLSRVQLIRRLIPQATFGADVMVGFPGEGESAFTRTCQLVEEVGFVNLHIFRYSPRVGTEAASLPNTVPAGKKRDRSERLTEVARRVRNKHFSSLFGQEEKVLIEQKRDGHWRGYTRGYIDTFLANEEDVSVGDEVRVRIVRATDTHLEGAKDDRASLC